VRGAKPLSCIRNGGVLDLRDEQAEAAGIHGDVEFPCGGHLAFPVVAGEEQGPSFSKVKTFSGDSDIKILITLTEGVSAMPL
jgi:hypothetical protein